MSETGMTVDLSQRRWIGLGRAWVVVLMLLAVAGRAVFLMLPVNSDTAMFVYAGKLVAEGGRPGVDLLDNKLPSVGLLMSAPWNVFGPHWTGYACLGLTLSVLAAWFLYRAARDVWGESAAKVCAVAAVLWMNFPPAVYGQLQLETIQIALASIAGACLLRALRTADVRDAFTAGLAGSLAAWAKPTGAAVIAAGVIAIWLSHREWRWKFRLIGAVLRGAAIPAIACLMILISAGYAESLPATMKQLRDYSSQSTLNAMDIAKPLLVLGLLGFPVLIFAWIFRHDPKSATNTRSEQTFVLLWLACELAGVVLQRRMYAYHFIVLAPPAALLTGMVARRVSAMSISMAFGPAVALSAWMTVSTLAALPGESREDRVIAFVRDHASASDAVWMDDYPRLLVETDRRPGSTVPLVFLMANSDTAPEFFGDRLLADWAARRPTYIVLPADVERWADLYRFHMADVAASPRRAESMAKALHAMQTYVAEHYRAEAEIGSLKLWRLSSPVSTASVAP